MKLHSKNERVLNLYTRFCEGKAITKDDMEDIMDGRTEEGLGEIRQELQSRMDDLEILKAQLMAEVGEEATKEITKKIENIENSIGTIDSYMMDKDIAPALRKYKKDYDDAMAKLNQELADAKSEATVFAQNKATAEAQRKFDVEVAKIRKEAQEHIARLEENFGRQVKEGAIFKKEGVYASEFTDTINGIKTSDQLNN